MRKLFFPLLALMMSFIVGCQENIDTSARYVFKEHTVISYLEAHQDVYSEYLDLLHKVQVSRLSNSNLYQLMSARGNYTVFAITNDAIKEYLQTLVDQELITEPTWNSFTDSTKLDSIRTVIVKNSIIDGKDIISQRYNLATLTALTRNGEIPLANLNDKKLTVYWDEKNLNDLFINGDCPMDGRNCDIEVLNGVIHQIHKVIAPNDISAASYFQEILDKRLPGYYVYASLLKTCGLFDTLSVMRDEVYEDLYQRGLIDDYEDFMTKGFTDQKAKQSDDACMPEHRYIGFTLFLEPDSYWQSKGIDPYSPTLAEDVTAWIQENGYVSKDYNLNNPDYTSNDNVLNHWITYHILPFRVQANKLVYHENELGYSRSNPYKYTIPVYEYYTTMGHRRLIKIYESSLSGGVRLNRFPVTDNGRKGKGVEISCLPEKEGWLVYRDDSLTVVNDIGNANIYPLYPDGPGAKPLCYDDATRDNLAKDRIRFDGMSLMPEAITNEVRRRDSEEPRFQFVHINPDSKYKYFENMSINDDATFIYFNGYRYGWLLYRNDEMKALGNYDIMFKLPPVPRRGTYELRYKILATGSRGIMQVYFGSDPNNLPVAGIPIDIRKTLQDGNTGWEAESEDDMDFNAEVDKRMRNNGYMHGILGITGDGHQGERSDTRISRRILARQVLDPNETYYIRMKSVLDEKQNEFFMDYMELCPKEVYDNPETPEDVW